MAWSCNEIFNPHCQTLTIYNTILLRTPMIFRKDVVLKKQLRVELQISKDGHYFYWLILLEKEIG